MNTLTDFLPGVSFGDHKDGGETLAHKVAVVVAACKEQIAFFEGTKEPGNKHVWPKLNGNGNYDCPVKYGVLFVPLNGENFGADIPKAKVPAFYQGVIAALEAGVLNTEVQRLWDRQKKSGFAKAA